MEGEGISQRTCMPGPQTDNNSVVMVEGLGESGQREGNGDVCESVNDKNKEKRNMLFSFLFLKHVLVQIT